MPDLLYEIGTEELPAGYLAPALEQLAAEVRRLLGENRLGADEVRTAGTPRRITLAVTGLPERQPAVHGRTVGPPARVAFDGDGAPTAAAEGFARRMGVPVGALEVEETEKGPYVVARWEEPGRATAELLPDVLERATAAVGFPKSMHWGKDGFQFARPIRWIVALLGDEVLSLRLAGVAAGRATRGHPFLARGPVELRNASFDDYLDALRDHFVIADVGERRSIIRREIESVLERHGSSVEDEVLLEEVANMVEFPHAVEGRFNDHFLEVPASVLCAAMKEHQRYFPVRDAEGRLVARFVTVSNRPPEHDDIVREGNERVLGARLGDARFFWQEDGRRRLEDLVPRLAEVVFLGGLGDNLQRTERLVELAGGIARKMGPGVSVEHVERAAHLCKADLLTGLVGEFPSLQGVVGGEMARAGGEPDAVADAMAEHYLPAGAGDALPRRPEAAALALADKLDVIVACFSQGLLPSGSQDPYALRRNALGILLIIEKVGLDLHLGELVGMARATLRRHGIECDEEAAARIREFFRDRLYHAAIERGFRHDFVRAVQAPGTDDVRKFWCRLAALAECAEQPWWPQLVEVVDRTYRIQRDVERIVPVRDDLLPEPVEKELARALDENQDAIARLFKDGEYASAAEMYCYSFASLVHEFFEDVFVNVEDDELRLNRKSLLGWVYQLFAKSFADLYLIETTDV